MIPPPDAISDISRDQATVVRSGLQCISALHDTPSSPGLQRLSRLCGYGTIMVAFVYLRKVLWMRRVRRPGHRRNSPHILILIILTLACLVEGWLIASFISEYGPKGEYVALLAPPATLWSPIADSDRRELVSATAEESDAVYNPDMKLPEYNSAQDEGIFFSRVLEFSTKDMAGDPVHSSELSDFTESAHHSADGRRRLLYLLHAHLSGQHT